MQLNELLAQELQQELQLTEKVMSRVPADKMDWKPHEKSMSVQQLISHLAEIPLWVNGTFEVDEMDLSGYKPPVCDSKDDAINTLKEGGQKAVDCLKGCNDEDFEKTWTMKQGDQVLMQMPKYNVLRTMVMNQFPHHRAQLGVYLRLLGEPVPATYGPSADEQPGN